MAEVHKMGTTTDLQNRITLQHIDNGARRAKIAKARKLVYKKGASINGITVTTALGPESMVPTTVRVSLSCLVVLDV
jgi:hypothetical protein